MMNQSKMRDLIEQVVSLVHQTNFVKIILKNWDNNITIENIRQMKHGAILSQDILKLGVQRCTPAFLGLLTSDLIFDLAEETFTDQINHVLIMANNCQQTLQQLEDFCVTSLAYSNGLDFIWWRGRGLQNAALQYMTELQEGLNSILKSLYELNDPQRY